MITSRVRIQTPTNYVNNYRIGQRFKNSNFNNNKLAKGRHRQCIEISAHQNQNYTRRNALYFLGMISLVGVANKALALPLAPLGKTKRVGAEKLVGQPAEKIMATLEKDLKEGQYFVTGNLTPEIFADDCRFKDPTNDITGLNRYINALKILFDPDRSLVTLKSIRVVSPTQIEAEWKLGGFLKFPWNPKIPAGNGMTKWTLNEDGIIQVQEQFLEQPAWKTLLQSFTPSFDNVGGKEQFA
eukprot:TRINITY_DN6810_c0_g1_i6.p2 TRINITY_DN6810_c0_g1~~TRINITY_DN6810_c0_g1_i6.p2  ORF type:complete len:262 (-),score=13.99 TRINITY_DN6810_c0_g1_i6:397-1119(-)